MRVSSERVYLKGQPERRDIEWAVAHCGFTWFVLGCLSDETQTKIDQHLHFV